LEHPTSYASFREAESTCPIGSIQGDAASLKQERGPSRKILWAKGNEKIRFNRPDTWFCLGLRGTGKSSLLEHVAEQHLAEGHVVFDLFGSRDGEGLAWLRSPHVKDKQVLLACMHEKAGIDIEKMPSEKCVEVHAGM
jgi:hypothetical protein